MILLLDTSASLCKLTLVNDQQRYEHEWQADRELAKGLLEYIVTTLAGYGKTIGDIKGIGIYRGPGSFTGLRIGMTTMNTIAASEGVPIVGASGEDWSEVVLKRLLAGENERIVVPEYGRAARITHPRK